MLTSDVSVTDLFCGAGGSSLGAETVGMRLRLAMNHWPVAISTHNSNFPDADHVCADVSQCDPRRYASTTILIASPECTNHTGAKGKKRITNQTEMLSDGTPDPAAERSRATMWDVPRFAEHHGYQMVIVENVVEASRWVMFDAWLLAMHSLGYEHKLVFTNSMHTLRVPQSRDRMYGVFWRRGNKAPALEMRPLAFCPRCDEDVPSVQAWKRPDKRTGKYRQQYRFCCPRCADVLEPYARPAADAIDWTLPSKRIGDRLTPLAENTMRRIESGIERYWPAVVLTAAGNTYEYGTYRRVYSTDAPVPVQTTTVQHGIALDPLLIGTSQRNGEARPLADPMATQTGRHVRAMVTPPLIAELRGGGSTARPVSDPLAAVCASGNHHALVMRNNWSNRTVEAVEPMPTATTATDLGMIEPPLVCQYNGNGTTRPVSLPLGTQSTRDRFGLVERPSGVRVEDCHFRMLEPHEIQAAMAFPVDYRITGNKRDRVRQLGNAVTPPVMEMLLERCMETLR